MDPCCTCNCFPCQFIARSWINVIEQAGVVANTCIRHHRPPQDLSEEDRWKVIDDYAYDYAVMIGLKDRLLDIRRYMKMEMKEQIEEERSVYSEEDFIDGVFDDFPSGYYYDFDNNNAVISEDDDDHEKLVQRDGQKYVSSSLSRKSSRHKSLGH